MFTPAVDPVDLLSYRVNRCRFGPPSVAAAVDGRPLASDACPGRATGGAPYISGRYHTPARANTGCRHVWPTYGTARGGGGGGSGGGGGAVCTLPFRDWRMSCNRARPPTAANGRHQLAVPGIDVTVGTGDLFGL